jgi:hypothetical protein
MTLMTTRPRIVGAHFSQDLPPFRWRDESVNRVTGLLHLGEDCVDELIRFERREVIGPLPETH